MKLLTTAPEEWSRLEVAFRISRRPVILEFASLITVERFQHKVRKSIERRNNLRLLKNPKHHTQQQLPPPPKAIQNTLHRPTNHLAFEPPFTTDNSDSFRGVPRGPAAATPAAPAIILPAGWKSAFDSESGKTYYYRRSDGKTQWEIPVDETNLPPSATAPAPLPLPQPQGSHYRNLNFKRL